MKKSILIFLVSGVFFLLGCSFHPPSYTHLLKNENPSGMGLDYSIPYGRLKKEIPDSTYGYLPTLTHLQFTWSKGLFHIMPSWNPQGLTLSTGIHNQLGALSIYGNTFHNPWQPVLGVNATTKLSEIFFLSLDVFQSYLFLQTNCNWGCDYNYVTEKKKNIYLFSIEMFNGPSHEALFYKFKFSIYTDSKSIGFSFGTGIGVYFKKQKTMQ